MNERTSRRATRTALVLDFTPLKYQRVEFFCYSELNTTAFFCSNISVVEFLKSSILQSHCNNQSFVIIQLTRDAYTSASSILTLFYFR